MRIHLHDTGPIGERDKVGGSTAGSSAASSPAAGAEGTARTPTPVHADVVSVSAAASGLSAQAARGRAAQTERVARVRAAVQAGTYRPDLDQLAHKIVNEELVRPRR